MQEGIKDDHILTINEVAAILRCSKTHVSHVLAGRVAGIPKLTHIARGKAETCPAGRAQSVDGGQ